MPCGASQLELECPEALFSNYKQTCHVLKKLLDVMEASHHLHWPGISKSEIWLVLLELIAYSPKQMQELSSRSVRIPVVLLSRPHMHAVLQGGSFRCSLGASHL